MTDTIFYLIGVSTVAGLALLAALYILIWIWYTFIDGKFGFILFTKTHRRLSIACWNNSKLMNDKYFSADDFPIQERPLYLSYEIGKRRLFFIAGILEAGRDMPIKGIHPEQKGD